MQGFNANLAVENQQLRVSTKQLQKSLDTCEHERTQLRQTQIKIQSLNTSLTQQNEFNTREIDHLRKLVSTYEQDKVDLRQQLNKLSSENGALQTTISGLQMNIK